ncbi:MAG: hypothetical protein ACE5E6_10015 [Phycisphaerae bacterium]
MGDKIDLAKLRTELEALKARASAIEAELVRGQDGGPVWPPKTYYTTYHILAGMVLGLIAAAASLLFNIVGAAMVGQAPLQLIRVYLTFPLGEQALALDSGFALAAGCCLYLGTGMFGGIPFHLVLSRYFASGSLGMRFAVASVMGLGIWIINYYVILYWLQPALIGGRWIVDEIPAYVAALTHLVFAWTMLLVDQWGRFVPPSGMVTEGKA